MHFYYTVPHSENRLFKKKHAVLLLHYDPKNTLFQGSCTAVLKKRCVTGNELFEVKN